MGFTVEVCTGPTCAFLTCLIFRIHKPVERSRSYLVQAFSDSGTRAKSESTLARAHIRLLRPRYQKPGLGGSTQQGHGVCTASSQDADVLSAPATTDLQRGRAPGQSEAEGRGSQSSCPAGLAPDDQTSPRWQWEGHVASALSVLGSSC